MVAKTFAEMEHASWEAKAAGYDAGFHMIVRMAYPAIISHLGADLTGRRVLDICCGTGELSAALTALGAEVTGIDFSQAMVATAIGKYPHIDFDIGDAEQLDLPEDSTDDIVCAFGLLHIPNPDRAIAEAARVLKPGGRYLYTVWNAPKGGSGLLDLVHTAIAEHGDPGARFPPAPPMFRFADEAEATAALHDAGFDNVMVEQVNVTWHPSRGREILDVVYSGTVRTARMLEAQTKEARARIEAAVIKKAEALRKGDWIAIPSPATIVSATKRR